MQTLTSLFRIVLTHDSGDQTFKSIDLLIGFNSADVQMQLLLRSLTAILTDSSVNKFTEEDEDDDRRYPSELKTLVLKLLLTMLTVSNLILLCHFFFKCVERKPHLYFLTKV